MTDLVNTLSVDAFDTAAGEDSCRSAESGGAFPSDAYPVEGLAAMIERANFYAQAGADIIFAEALFVE